MKTRSITTKEQTEPQELLYPQMLLESQKLLESQMLLDPPMIDFDEASCAWRQNKRSLSNGCFEYICKKNKKLSSPHQVEATPPRRNPPRRSRRNLNNGA